MKNFIEWMSENEREELKVNLDDNSMVPQIKAKLSRVIKESLAFLKNNREEDRVYFWVYGYNIKIWRTVINSKEKYHIGYRRSWEKKFTEFPSFNYVVNDFAEHLYTVRGSSHKPHNAVLGVH